VRSLRSKSRSSLSSRRRACTGSIPKNTFAASFDSCRSGPRTACSSLRPVLGQNASSARRGRARKEIGWIAIPKDQSAAGARTVPRRWPPAALQQYLGKKPALGSRREKELDLRRIRGRRDCPYRVRLAHRELRAARHRAVGLPPRSFYLLPDWPRSRVLELAPRTGSRLSSKRKLSENSPPIPSSVPFSPSCADPLSIARHFYDTHSGPFTTRLAERIRIFHRRESSPQPTTESPQNWGILVDVAGEK
jgi:hypothetical protein